MSTKRPLFLLYSLALGVAVSLAVSLTVWAAVPPAPQDFQLSGDPGRGKAIFTKNCALCHGPAGKGDGSMATSLTPRPQDLTDRAVMAKRSDWEIYVVIRDGGNILGLSPQMPSYKSLKDQEIRDLAAYIRSLAK